MRKSRWETLSTVELPSVGDELEAGEEFGTYRICQSRLFVVLAYVRQGNRYQFWSLPIDQRRSTKIVMMKAG
jgi:hypothetical protein